MLRIGFAAYRARLTVAAGLSWYALLLQPVVGWAQVDEFRAFWVDAFHAGFKSSAEVTTLVNNIRNGNCNAVVVELRKRGDAYYTPDTSYADYEPHATDTSPGNFDALAELISKAHDTNGGNARIEVHVWLVTWPVWGSTTPPSNPQHPYNRHPEWLTHDNTGATWNGQNYCLDPGHPGAFEHTYRIAINLVTNYDIDGINFDYVRYAGNTWGYNPTAVGRFHARYGGTGNPVSTDPNWLQFRRDQVTALVRKVYLNTIASKRNVKVSADTITWAPGPVNQADWYGSAAWSSVLQDWRGWMEEGILDLNIPMAYFRQSGPYTADWTNWCNFIRDNQYQRHAVIGPGIYLNKTADGIAQMRYTRTVSSAGNSVRGVCGYSYAVPDSNYTSFATFVGYLTNSPNSYDPIAPAIFSQPAAVPEMRWKTTPTAGHVMGSVFSGAPGNAADGAVVTISGSSVFRIQTNDATGFFGFVDLPPGTYMLRATMTGFDPVTNSVSVGIGAVTNVNVILSTNHSGQVSDIIIDNPAATVTGTWTTGTSAGDRYGTDYRFKSQGTGASYLQYTPSIITPGNYQLYEWHSVGSNRTTNAPFIIRFNGRTQTAYVNEKVNGGKWNLLGTFNFLYGASGYVRVTDGFADAGQVVIADAVKLVYVTPDEPPVILEQPRSIAAVPGGSASFSVSASSQGALTYQWLFNGAELVNEVQPVLSVSPVQPSSFGSYTVRLSNSGAWVLSDPAALVLATPPALTAVAGDGPQIQIGFTTEPGPTYSLEYTSDFSGTGWRTLTNFSGSGLQVSFSEFLAGGPLRLYRVRMR